MTDNDYASNGAAKRLAPQKRSAVLANYKQLREKVAMSEALVLDLLAHPDTTPEQIAEVRPKLTQTRKTLEDVWRSVDKLFDGQFISPPVPHHIEMRRKLRQQKREEQAEAAAAPSQPASAGPSM